MRVHLNNVSFIWYNFHLNVTIVAKYILCFEFTWLTYVCTSFEMESSKCEHQNIKLIESEKLIYLYGVYYIRFRERIPLQHTTLFGVEKIIASKWCSNVHDKNNKCTYFRCWFVCPVILSDCCWFWGHKKISLIHVSSSSICV